ncbi:MAG: hypothetical protein ACXW03_05850 [Methylobacter sp.]
MASRIQADIYEIMDWYAWKLSWRKDCTETEVVPGKEPGRLVALQRAGLWRVAAG